MPLSLVRRGVATLLALPLLVVHALMSRLVGEVRSFLMCAQFACLVPEGLGTLVREGFYRRAAAAVGERPRMSIGVICSNPGVRFGDGVYVGRFSSIGLATIGDHVMIGDQVHILSGGQHHGTDDPDRPVREQPGSLRRVHIGAETWIGSAAVVMADVGDHCVIGAGAVVTRAVPSGHRAVGNPARSQPRSTSS